MEEEESGAKLAPSAMKVKDSSVHWHCPPQTEASIFDFCHISNDFNPKDTSSAPLTKQGTVLVRMINMNPPQCRVISSDSHAVSAPLNQFTYDYRAKAFTNKEGFTWTPMYLHHCKPLVTDQLCHRSTQETNKNTTTNAHLKRPKQEVTAQLYSLLTSDASLISAPFWTKGKLGKSVVNWKPTSYSKFMESPYIRRKKYCLRSERFL